ncbi:MAG TPA: endonuclease III [Lentisphaeria bacterium]|nr:MAG: endonuclease III [Lentisphaerae bacterium GWF2_38_69]HBM15232.1 endonuclease III [Lentisphaeria bacterium]
MKVLERRKDYICVEIYRTLFSIYGKVKCPLFYRTPFQLLISVILSAQCTDERVNKTVSGLFAKYPDSMALSEADVNEIEKIIKPIGLYKIKAKNIINAAKKLNEEFGGEIPETIEKLTELPGVGRKTANVIISHLFDGYGFAVDTHVNRVLNRIGIVNTHNPYKIEMLIMKLMSHESLGNFSLLLIMHGRNTCLARTPKCPDCAINNLCRKRL